MNKRARESTKIDKEFDMTKPDTTPIDTRPAAVVLAKAHYAAFQKRIIAANPGIPMHDWDRTDDPVRELYIESARDGINDALTALAAERDEAVQRAETILKQLEAVATAELRNTSLLLSSPPQSSAAWNIRETIRAAIGEAQSDPREQAMAYAYGLRKLYGSARAFDWLGAWWHGEPDEANDLQQWLSGVPVNGVPARAAEEK